MLKRLFVLIVVAASPLEQPSAFLQEYFVQKSHNAHKFKLAVRALLRMLKQLFVPIHNAHNFTLVSRTEYMIHQFH